MVMIWSGSPPPDTVTFDVLDKFELFPAAVSVIVALLYPLEASGVSQVSELVIDISYEEANFIKETFIKDYTLREMALIPVKKNDVENDLAPGEVHFESVDQIVTDQITNIESEFYDNALLLKIYQSL